MRLGKLQFRTPGAGENVGFAGCQVGHEVDAVFIEEDKVSEGSVGSGDPNTEAMTLWMVEIVD